MLGKLELPGQPHSQAGAWERGVESFAATSAPRAPHSPFTSHHSPSP
jgi:hypothetical protein